MHNPYTYMHLYAHHTVMIVVHGVYMYVEEQEVYTNGLFLFIVLLCKKKEHTKYRKQEMDIGMVQARQGIRYTGNIIPACF